MARKSGHVLRRGVMRRESLWFAGVYVRSVLGSASTAVIQTSLNAGALALRPFTIVRTRGHILYRSDQESAAENQDVSFGMAVVSDQSVAIGVTAVPTPFADNGSDLWFVYESMSARFGFITGVGFDQQSGVERIVDSKAMRKVEGGQDVIIAAETADISGGVTITSFVRMLIKLH